MGSAWGRVWSVDGVVLSERSGDRHEDGLGVTGSACVGVVFWVGRHPACWVGKSGVGCLVPVLRTSVGLVGAFMSVVWGCSYIRQGGGVTCSCCVRVKAPWGGCCYVER
jgi:hypothetical protein